MRQVTVILEPKLCKLEWKMVDLMSSISINKNINETRGARGHMRWLEPEGPTRILTLAVSGWTAGSHMQLSVIPCQLIFSGQSSKLLHLYSYLQVVVIAFKSWH